MKTLSSVLLSLLVVLMLGGVSQVHSQPRPCDYFDSLSVDTVTTTETFGLPGTTANMPVLLKNDSRIAAFEIYMEYDSNLINPVIKFVDTTIDTTVINTYFIDTSVVGTDTTIDTTLIASDTTIDTLVNRDYEWNLIPSEFDTTNTGGVRLREELDYPGPGSRKRMVFNLLPRISLDPNEPPVNAIDSGRHEIATIPMHIDPGAPLDTFTFITFYRETVYSDSIPPQQIGCIFSRYFDSTGIPTHRLMEAYGRLRVRSGPPIINLFEAADDTVFQGEQTTLSWDVTDADQVSIDQGIGIVDSIGQTSTAALSSTTTFTLTATNANGSSQRSVTVIVIQAPPNNRPEFTEPTVTAYTIEQGQTLGFAVTATDADNDNLTLTATNLPSNSTFGPSNPVIGVGSVTGTFSFTPDFAQEGTFQVTFTADDGKPAGSRQLSVTIVVEPIKFDRLFTTSATGQAPRGGRPGTPTIMIPINLVTAQTVYGIQFDFTYDDQWFRLDSIMTTLRTQDFVVYENIGQTPGQVRVVTFGVGNEVIVQDTASTAILYMVMTIDSVAVPGEYPLVLENGWESTNPDPNFPSLPLLTDGGVIQVDRLGDINLDKQVDVADAVAAVGYILGSFGLSQRQFAAGDVIINSSIDVVDLVGIINIIFGLPPSPTGGFFIPTELATISLEYPDLDAGTAGTMAVSSELPEDIAGVQLELLYDRSAMDLGAPVLGADATDMVLSSSDKGDGKLTVLLYFKNPLRAEGVIREGAAELVRVPILAETGVISGDESQMRLSNAVLSTPQAIAVGVAGIDPELPTGFALRQNYPNPFNPTTTIEFTLGLGADGLALQPVRLDVYNILGQQVTTVLDQQLPPGEYSVEWDATNSAGQRVATGIYLYRLKVGDANQTKKMILLK